MEHEYDGLREYDNPLPRWWVWIFWATIVYALLYALNVPGIGMGRGRIAQYEQDIARAREQFGDRTATGFTDQELSAIVTDMDRVGQGKMIFDRNCMVCHKADGGGSIGPNLTDGYWIHGDGPAMIATTVTNGVLVKGMPAWSTMLKPDEIKNVVAYVLTLKGTNPPGAKGPEGLNQDSLRAAASANPAATTP
jgi:cytochrome c oxidase cbb3-type subunit 3